MSENCNRFETFERHNHAWQGVSFAVRTAWKRLFERLVVELRKEVVEMKNLNTPYAGKVTGLKVSRGAADAGLAKMGD